MFNRAISRPSSDSQPAVFHKRFLGRAILTLLLCGACFSTLASGAASLRLEKPVMPVVEETVIRPLESQNPKSEQNVQAPLEDEIAELIPPCDPFSDPDCRAEVELDNGERYLGRLIDGVPNGPGELTLADGTRYEGFFERGLKMGQGKMTLADGSSFEGFWVRDRLNGPVVFTKPSGDQYRGMLSEDYLPSGIGQMTYASGGEYRGNFESGLPQGEGVMVFGRDRGDNSGDRHEGLFDRGLRDGPGRYIFADGTEWQVSCERDQCERAGFTGWLLGTESGQAK
jgi:hypothetical protein